MINHMVTLVLGCIFPNSGQVPTLRVRLPDPSVGRLDANVNKVCTVTVQPRQRVEASCQLPVGVQSRLMGSKKALRKRGNFRNSKTTNSLNHFEGCLVLGKTALDSMQMSSQGGLHWGTGDLLGLMRAMD